MTIKQQGGVFGRNPSFNTVEIASGNNKLGEQAYLQSGSMPQLSIHNLTGERVRLRYDTNAGRGVLGTQANADFRFERNGSEIFTMKSTGIAMANGLGIDFSATSGTGTSELFDDYEEGTWTPAPSRFTGGGISATYNTQAGYYTKVGNLVTCSLFIDIASISSQGSSLTYIGGLPYAPARSYYDAGTTGNNTGIATVDVVSFVAHTDSRLYLRQSGNTAANSSADWAAGALSGTITYMTS